MLVSSEQDVQQFSCICVEAKFVEGLDCPKIPISRYVSLLSFPKDNWGEAFLHGFSSACQNLRSEEIPVEKSGSRASGPSGLVSLLAVVGQGECSLQHLNNVSGVGSRGSSLPMSRLPENWGFVARVAGSIPVHPIYISAGLSEVDTLSDVLYVFFFAFEGSRVFGLTPFRLTPCGGVRPHV